MSLEREGIEGTWGGRFIGLLFPFLKRRGKMLFGSKWLNLHGKLLIGTPESMGLPLDGSPGVEKSFYYLKVDRKLPKTGELRSWESSQLYATQIREAGRPYVAKTASFMAFLVCVVVLAVAIPVPLMFKGIEKAKAELTATPEQKAETAVAEEAQKGFSNNPKDWNQEKCKVVWKQGMTVWMKLPSNIQTLCSPLVQ